MKKKIIIAVVLVAVAIGGLIYGYKQVQTVVASAKETVASEIARTINSGVTIGNVNIAGINTITIADITFSDKGGQPFGKAETVVISYNILDLLVGNAPLKSIRSLAVHKPEVILRQNAAGRWNVQDLLPEQNEQAVEFRPIITIIDGTSLIQAQAGDYQVKGINGKLDLSDYPTIAVDLVAVHHEATIKIKGNMGKDRVALRIAADRVEIADYRSVLPPDMPVSSLGGTLHNLFFAINKNAQGELRYLGEFNLTRGHGDYQQYQISDASAFVAFNEKELFLYQGQAAIAGQTIAVSGKVQTNGLTPLLDLRVATESFDPMAINDKIPVKGSVAFSGKVKGTPAAPEISGRVQMAQGYIQEYLTTNAFAVIHYANNKFDVTQAEAQILGGKLRANGTVLIEPLTYQFAIAGTQLDTKFADEFIPGTSGKVDVNLLVDGETDISSARIRGTIKANNISWKNFNLLEMQAGFLKDIQNITVDYIYGRTASGTIAGQGKIENSKLAFTVSGSHLASELANALVPQAKVSGMADFTAQVTGTLPEPCVALEFKIEQGGVFDQPYQSITGKLIADSNQVVLQDIKLFDGPTRHVLNGRVAITEPDYPVDMTVSTIQARAENLIKIIMPQEQLTGNVDNKLHLTGSLNDLQAEGKVLLTEGSFRGNLIARAEGTYSRKNGVIQLRDFDILSLNTRLKVAGVIQADSTMDLDLAAQDINLAQLQLNLPYPVQGLASFEGKLTGLPQEPILHGRIFAQELIANKQQIRDAKAGIEINGNQINITDLDFQQNQGQYKFNGGFNLTSQDIFGRVEIENGDIQSLLEIFMVPSGNVAGRITGEVIASGKLDEPNVWLTGKLNDGKIKNVAVENVDIDLALVNGVITVNEFNARQGAGRIIIKGRADKNGPVNIEMGAINVDAGLLTAWLDSAVDFTGKLNMIAQITGTADKPNAALSLDIKEGKVASADFDDLYGLFIINKQSIEVNQLFMAKGDYKASAYGIIPLNALNPKGRKQASTKDQMELKIKLDKADLSILPFLTKNVTSAAGPTKGEVTVGGTLVAPRINGSLKINDGTIKLAGLNSPIQKVGVDIQFQGDRIDIRTMAGQMGQGQYSLTGSAAISGLSIPQYNFALTMDRLGIDGKYFKGPLSGQVSMDSNDGKASLTGNLTFERDTIIIPTVMEFKKTDLDFNMDLNINIGSRVHVYNPLLFDIWLEPGQINFAGSTARPDVTGFLRVAHGSVSYLRTPFKITDGTATFNQYESLEPFINLQGNTRLVSTRVNLKVQGPLSQMDFRLSSEPSMSQQSILSLLTLRSRFFDKQNNASGTNSFGSDELLSMLDAGLQISFISEVEESARQALGLDGFRFIRTSTTEEAAGQDNTNTSSEGYSVQVSKYIGDNLMLTYTTGIKNDNTNFGVQYDLTRRVSVTGSVDNNNRYQVGLEMRFSF